MILSLVLFSLMDAGVKWLGSSYATAQIMFFRCFVAMIPVITIIAMRGGLQLLKTQQKKLIGKIETDRSLSEFTQRLDKTIKKALKQGYSKDKLRKELIDKDWPKDIINRELKKF